MKVYDTEGKEHDLPSVDVKECVEILGWTEEPPKKTKPEPNKRKK